MDPLKTAKARLDFLMQLHDREALLPREQQRRFLDLAVAEPAVAEAYAVTGRTDVVLTLRLQDMDEFDALCERLFREGSGVKRFFTMVVIRTAKEDTTVAL